MLQLEGVTWTLPGGEEIVRGVDLEIGDGKLVVITGPNGGGKTSLVKLIAGVEQATTGKILLDGEEITHMDVTERVWPMPFSSRSNLKALRWGICWSWPRARF